MNNLQLHQCLLDRRHPKVSYISLSKNFIKCLMDRISLYMNSSPEPRVWKSKTRKGEVIWHIYHPKTNRSAHFSSEQEARSWIEEQYYY